MHSEFFDDPQERMEILIMEAFCRIEKGDDKSSVLSKLGLTEEEYDNNVKQVLPLSTT